MSLDVRIRHRNGDFTLDVAFAAARGLTALFGPSGAGKTTVVNSIAGLVKPQSARITIDGLTLIDTEQGINLPTAKRRLGYVFQEPRLFPHLSVRNNLLYGRWFQTTRATAQEFDRVVATLGLGALLSRRPETLSGGEKQRTAIGRALLASPRLLLLDEPLTALDEARKQEILPYLERLRDDSDIPIVYVSHSLAEVGRLAQTIVLMSDGQVRAAGPAVDIMHRLDLPNMSGSVDAGALIDAEVTAHDHQWGLTTLTSQAGVWTVPGLDLSPGTAVRMRVLSRDVTLALTKPDGVSALNIIEGRIAEIGAGSGAMLEIRLDCHGEALIARVTRASVNRMKLGLGMPVWALVKSVAIEQRSLGWRS